MDATSALELVQHLYVFWHAVAFFQDAQWVQTEYRFLNRMNNDLNSVDYLIDISYPSSSLMNCQIPALLQKLGFGWNLSFKDEGFGLPPQSKLTGPRYYSRESLRDVFICGTHFASAVAGNAVEDENFNGLGNERGVPAAKIATYKVCELFCCCHIRPSQLEHVRSQMSQDVAEKYTMPTNSSGLNCSSFSGLPLVLQAQACFIPRYQRTLRVSRVVAWECLL
ncbi:hypothetical protein ACFX2C_005890 [Malus domestica]